MAVAALDKKIAVVAGVRTPFVKSFGELRQAAADDLGVVALRELLARAELDEREVDEVIVGCVGQPTSAMNVARVIALRAGLPKETPAYTVHRNCASALEAVTSGVEKILTGQADVIVAGGTESMSNLPVTANPGYVALLERFQRAKSAWQKIQAALSFRPRMMRATPTLTEGLTDKTCGLIMGMTAENLAREFGLSREEQDAYALASHQKVARAYADDRLADELVPVYAPPKRNAVSRDIGFRANQTLEALAKLKPFFDRRYGSVTVGNACPITDGAVMLLLMPLSRAKAEGREVLGVLEGYAYAGLDPSRMGLGPVFATAKVLDRLGIGMQDVDLFELNEAFAAQVLACLKAFESDSFARRDLNRSQAVGALDPEKLNVNGGAIALGHPVGATGGRLVLTLLREMKRRDVPRGVATLCVGGGLGAALVFSRDGDAVNGKASAPRRERVNVAISPTADEPRAGGADRPERETTDGAAAGRVGLSDQTSTRPTQERSAPMPALAPSPAPAAPEMSAAPSVPAERPPASSPPASRGGRDAAITNVVFEFRAGGDADSKATQKDSTAAEDGADAANGADDASERP